jgi:hypothetical protein
MQIGPLQMIVIGFQNQEISEQVAYELSAVRKQGLIRLIDFVFVEKSLDGELSANALSDLNHEDAKRFLALIQGTAGFSGAGVQSRAALEDTGEASDTEALYISSEDINSIVEHVSPGGAVMIALIEHLWASRLSELIENSGGALFAEKYIPPSGVRTWGPALVKAVKATAEPS